MKLECSFQTAAAIFHSNGFVRNWNVRGFPRNLLHDNSKFQLGTFVGNDLLTTAHKVNQKLILSLWLNSCISGNQRMSTLQEEKCCYDQMFVV